MAHGLSGGLEYPPAPRARPPAVLEPHPSRTADPITEFKDELHPNKNIMTMRSCLGGRGGKKGNVCGALDSRMGWKGSLPCLSKAGLTWVEGSRQPQNAGCARHIWAKVARNWNRHGLASREGKAAREMRRTGDRVSAPGGILVKPDAGVGSGKGYMTYNKLGVPRQARNSQKQEASFLQACKRSVRGAGRLRSRRNGTGFSDRSVYPCVCACVCDGARREGRWEGAVGREALLGRGRQKPCPPGKPQLV